MFVDVPIQPIRVPATAIVAEASGPGFETVRVRTRTTPRLRSAPGGKVVARAGDRTPYGTRTRLWVRAQRGRWLKVSTNDVHGNAGWLDVDTTAPAPRLRREIVIDRSQRRLTVIDGRRRWSTPIVLGAPATPTPTGTFQVTDRLPGRRFAGTYGHWVLVLSAYGTAAETSRLAIHGVPPSARSLTGSAGCVRVPQRALDRLAGQTGPGTPVRIVA